MQKEAATHARRKDGPKDVAAGSHPLEANNEWRILFEFN
jgi:hypothetical protein